MCWTLLLLDSRIHTSLLAVNARRWLASWSSETHRGQKHHDRDVVARSRRQIQLTSAEVHIRRDKDCMPAQVTSPRGPSPAFVQVVILSSSGNIAAKVPALLRPQIP
ncbi:unnamed protein product [Symbiodinium sp. CCMP2456]|nr:unnamed protein product [Symbiodinium sp. CCMP2456]